MSKSALRVVSIFFLAITAFGSSIHTNNDLLNKILKSATPDTFAECTPTSTYCGIYDSSATVYEDVTSFAHSQSLGIGVNGNVTQPITFNLVPDAQCTLSSSIFTIGTGFNPYNNVTVTAVDDLISEASPHPCVITATVTAGNTGFPPGFSGFTVSVDVIDNDAPADTLVTNHTSLALNEDPTFLESQDIDQLIINLPSASSGSSSAFGTDTITVKADTDSQCYVSNTNDFSSKLNTMTIPGNIFQLPSDTINIPFNFKARQDDVVEGPHTCVITYTYTHPFYSVLNRSETVVATVADYRPGVNANGPEILYEKPAEGQSSEGFVQLKLARQPSDLDVVVANLTSLNPADCVLESSSLVYTQANWNSLQQIKVSAVKDGVYQPGTRDCKIRIVLNSGETPAPGGGGGYLINPLVPKAILASSKYPQVFAALEYNNVSQDIIVKVLDADTLPQTGLRNPWMFLGSTILLVATLLSTVYTYRAYKLKPEELLAIEEKKVQL
jgi:hypothetical protein